MRINPIAIAFPPRSGSLSSLTSRFYKYEIPKIFLKISFVLVEAREAKGVKKLKYLKEIILSRPPRLSCHEYPYKYVFYKLNYVSLKPYYFIPTVRIGGIDSKSTQFIFHNNYNTT